MDAAVTTTDGDAPSAANAAGTVARTSAIFAVGLVVVVAVVAAAALVVWARIAADRGEQSEGLALAFGIEPGPLPPQLPPAAEGQLVVGARNLAAPPPEAGDCGLADSSVVALPEAVLVLGDPGGGQGVTSCVMQPGGVSASSGFGGATQFGVIGGGCCTPEGFGWSEALLEVPDGTAWALQDRGGWWVAYPVSGSQVHMMWTHGSGGEFRPGGFAPGGGEMPPVVFLDEQGGVIGDTGA